MEVDATSAPSLSPLTHYVYTYIYIKTYIYIYKYIFHPRHLMPCASASWHPLFRSPEAAETPRCVRLGQLPVDSFPPPHHPLCPPGNPLGGCFSTILIGPLSLRAGLPVRLEGKVKSKRAQTKTTKSQKKNTKNKLTSCREMENIL